VLAAQGLRYRERRVTRLGFLGTGLIARYIYTSPRHGRDIAEVICADAQRTMPSSSPHVCARATRRYRERPG